MREVAERHWSEGRIPGTDPVLLLLLYFHDADTSPLDVDNIPKPIADALNGLVYADDGQVTDLVCRKRHIGDDLYIENTSAVLAAGFARGNEFLYVRVEDAPEHEVIF